MPGNVLLLQGPMGPFFKRLAKDLEVEDGTTVYKINFNAGDWLYFRGERTISYAGTLAQWPDFLAARIAEWQIDTIYLFGDTRLYHGTAIDVARWYSIRVGVFEEGYLRPRYVTLEQGGVNQRSSLPRDPEFYRKRIIRPERPPRPVKHAFAHAAWHANWYYIAGWLGRFYFPHYMHHRPFNPFAEAFFWLRAAVRKHRYRLQQRGIAGRLRSGLSGKYFLVPLQVHCDGQVRSCEHVVSAATFIRRVIGSFVRNAPAGTYLVLKHHPLDRGYTDYTQLIEKLSKRYACRERILYVHDLHLPTLLDHAIGTVVINSTTGISSLFHDTPVITLGDAIYDMPGLTFQGELDEFWREPGKVNRMLYRKFRSYLLETCQINGNFYAVPSATWSRTGMDVRRLRMQEQRAGVHRAAFAAEQIVFTDINLRPAQPVPRSASDSGVRARPASYADDRAVALSVCDDTVP